MAKGRRTPVQPIGNVDTALVLQHLISLGKLTTLKTLSFDTIMRKVAEEMVHLLKAEYGGIYLYDTATEALVLQNPHVGFSEQKVSPCRLPISETSMVGRVFLTGKSYLSNQVVGNPMIKQSLVELASTIDGLSLRNIFCAPLQVEQQRIGVVELFNRRHRGFGPDDERRLQVIAPMAALVIHNAIQFQNSNHQQERLENRLLAVEQLNQTVAKGGGLPQLLETLAALVGNPVLLQDRYHHALAAAEPSLPGAGAAARAEHLAERIERVIGSRQARDTLQSGANAGAGSHLSLPVPGESPVNCVVMPVRSGGHTYGWLWIPEVHRSLGDGDMWVVSHAETLLMLEFLRRQAIVSTEMPSVESLIDALLYGRHRQGYPIIEQARRFGLDLGRPHFLLLIHADQADLTDADLYGLAKRALPPRLGKGLLALADGKNLVLLMPGRGREIGDGEQPAVAAAVQQALHDIDGGAGVSCIYSGPCRNLDDYPQEYQRALRCIPLLAARPGEQVLSYYTLGMDGLFLNLSDPTPVQLYCSRVLEPLSAGERNSRLLQTLQVYLNHNGHLGQTAGALHIHISTLRYRLGRIQELTGVDLGDPQARFQLQLALKALPFIEAR